jgi:hypothetical protein
LARLPAHGVATVDALAATITYTPTTNFNGVDTLEYVAGWGLPATVTITVTPTPEPPAFMSQPPTGAVERLPYTYRIAAADPDPGDHLSITASTLPSWLTLSDNGDSTAVLSGTAALADLSVYPLTHIGAYAAAAAFVAAVAPVACEV